MRTLILIVAGLLLAFACLRFAPPAMRRLMAIVFSLAWLLVVGWNLRTGLSHGYTLEEELPIQAAIFLVPAILAFWLGFRRSPRA
jgi:hypothetical protein